MQLQTCGAACRPQSCGPSPSGCVALRPFSRLSSPASSLLLLSLTPDNSQLPASRAAGNPYLQQGLRLHGAAGPRRGATASCPPRAEAAPARTPRSRLRSFAHPSAFVAGGSLRDLRPATHADSPRRCKSGSAGERRREGTERFCGARLCFHHAKRTFEAANRVNAPITGARNALGTAAVLPGPGHQRQDAPHSGRTLFFLRACRPLQSFFASRTAVAAAQAGSLGADFADQYMDTIMFDVNAETTQAAPLVSLPRSQLSPTHSPSQSGDIA